jgi:outer membrane protein insertion porin family
MTDAQWNSITKIRVSLGFGISWISPLGPLRIAYALPVVYQKEEFSATGGFIPEDRIQHVQFQIGTSF